MKIERCPLNLQYLTGAPRYQLFPLVSQGIPKFDLLRALNHGLLPRHYLAEDPGRMIQAYVGEYLKEEIAAECRISAVTVRKYFEILEETLVGTFVPSFQKRPKRWVIQAPRFYYFDVGLANFLLKRGTIVSMGETFGKALEHFIFKELTAHRHYSGLEYPLSYWRTASQEDKRIPVELKFLHFWVFK